MIRQQLLKADFYPDQIYEVFAISVGYGSTSTAYTGGCTTSTGPVTIGSGTNQRTVYQTRYTGTRYCTVSRNRTDKLRRTSFPCPPTLQNRWLVKVAALEPSGSDQVLLNRTDSATSSRYNNSNTTCANPSPPSLSNTSQTYTIQLIRRATGEVMATKQVSVSSGTLSVTVMCNGRKVWFA